MNKEVAGSIKGGEWGHLGVPISSYRVNKFLHKEGFDQMPAGGKQGGTISGGCGKAGTFRSRRQELIKKTTQA